MHKEPDTKEVYKHFGLDIEKMLEQGEEHEWGICPAEKAKEITNNMAGFGMEESHQITIDYDKDYEWVLVRRFNKHAGQPAASRMFNELINGISPSVPMGSRR